MVFYVDAALPRVIDGSVAGRLGITKSRVRTEMRRGNWRRLATGFVLTRPDEPTRADWADVGISLAGAGGALTGWDAVRLRGLGQRMPEPDLVTVVTRRAMNRVVGGVRLRRSTRPYTARRQPLGGDFELVPIVSTARAVADAALLCADTSAVLSLVTSAVQRRRCTIAELVAEYDAGPRCRSVPLRQALAAVEDGARSAAEAAVARKLARAPIPPFELNVDVVDHRGRVLWTLDVLWRELRAVLEIDSREHHFAVDAWEATMTRHNRLTRHRLETTHWAPSVIMRNDDAFVCEVAAWLRARSVEISVPWPAGRGVRRPGPNGPVPIVVR